MRIVYVGDMTNIHMRRWSGFFAQRGHEVHVITTKAYNGDVPPGLTVHELIAPRSRVPVWGPLIVALNIPKMVAKLRRLFARLQPDIVHVHYVNEAALWAVLARPAALVLTAWGSDILVAPQRSFVRRMFTRYILRRVSLITCDADHMKMRMVALGAPPDRTRVLFFGTDVERFHPTARDAELRRQHGGDPAALVISIRNLEPVYDIATLIRAVPHVLDSIPQTRFLIGGRGSLADALRQQARDLGVEHAVVFLGSLTQDQLPPLLASCDVYISAALSDGGIAASTAEAMAAGTPVIISDVCDNSTWVRSDENGILFPQGNERALAAAITRVLKDPLLAQRLGRLGRDEIVERNNLYVEMGKMQELYDSVAGATPK